MQSHLFVYGSLVAAAGHPNGARLRSEALLIGPATIAGRLYRVSWYPALRPAVTRGDRVHGEIYRLIDPAMSFTWLDAYEGITQGPNSGTLSDDYVRAERLVTLGGGESKAAWVYLYQRELAAADWVASGQWQG